MQAEAEARALPELALVNPFLYNARAMHSTENVRLHELASLLHQVYAGARGGAHALSLAPYRLHDSPSEMFLYLASQHRQQLVLAALSSPAPDTSTSVVLGGSAAASAGHGAGRDAPHCGRDDCVAEAWPGGAGLCWPHLVQAGVVRSVLLCHHDDERALLLQLWAGRSYRPFVCSVRCRVHCALTREWL